jgi:hypothetical protein
MKKVLYLLLGIFAVTSSIAQTHVPLEFTEIKHNVGKVKQGVPVTHVFTFKNVTEQPVVIESATASCGCTTPEYPKGAISKGATGQIKVTYNAATVGAFTKPVTVKVANVKDPIILNIEGEVASTATAGTGAATASTTAAKTATSASPKSKAAVSKSTTTKTQTVKQ